ncbi:MAG: dihydroneopterin aldolase family protein [Candidatus Odinarchaeia archaeon]
MSEDDAKKYFAKEITDRERAVFEAGIKIATIYHQFIGTPIPRTIEEVHKLEHAIEESIKTQPWVENVKINLKDSSKKTIEYEYDEISAYTLKAEVITKYKKAEVKAKLEYIEELAYPLAFITEIKENE